MISSRGLKSVYFIFAGYLLLEVISNNRWAVNAGMLLALQLLAPAVSTSFLLLAGLKNRGGRRIFWFLLSFGCLLYFFGLAIWFYYAGFAHVEPPMPSVADYLWNFQTIMFLLAICYIIASEKSVLRSLQYGFDTLLFMLILGLISWQYVIEPNYSAIITSPSVISAAIYPISDFAITCALLIMLSRNRSLFSRRVQITVISGFLIFVVADTGYFFLVCSNTYKVGQWVDTAYSIGLLLFGLSGMYACNDSGVKDVKVEEAQARWWFQIITPILYIVLLYSIIVDHIQGFDMALWGSLGVLLLIFVRQVMMIFENRSLMAHKITLWKKAEFLACHDFLSKLPNRRFFEMQLTNELFRIVDRKDSMLAVLFLDLDRFKMINDSLGHSIGDLLVEAVAERLATLVDSRHLIARVGGDEYTILIKDLQSYDELDAFMKKIHETLRDPFQLGAHHISITTSIGASVCPHHGVTANDLMRNADAAMYKSKALGYGGGYIFTPDLEKENTAKAAMEQELHSALQREEFILHYQPQVRTQDGQMIGIEALIRWYRQGGLVSPGVFIPLAEETGLIIPIGEWVLRTSCRQAKKWLDERISPFCLSVNVSPKQFAQENFVRLVRGILEETGFPPCLLILEITESIAIQDGEETVDRLVALKKMGVQISMDDFGTGYTSLHYLQQFHVDCLKMAQSFIRGIDDIRNQAVVKAILAMATSLKLTVVAEGVETEGQYQFLKEHGCDVIQGYYFYKPFPASELERIVFKRQNVCQASGRE